MAAVDWASIIAGNIAPLSGSSFVYLSDLLGISAPLSLASEVMSALSVPLIKISVAIMLLRLLRGKYWKRFLYVIIAVQVVMAVFVTLMQTTRCVPIKGLWDPAITDKKCWSEHAFRVSLSFTSVVTILTDVILSLIPLTFILNIKRPLRERLMIVLLMGLGMFASAASIAKTVVIQSYTESAGPDNAMLSGMKIALWSAVEEQVGIIAACLPCLKSLFHRILRRLGLTTMAGTTKPGYPSHPNGNPTISVRTHIETVRHKTVTHREGSLGSDEEELVDLNLGNGSVEMKCMKA